MAREEAALEEKIRKAKEYLAFAGSIVDGEARKSIRNDAANIYADSYEEYMSIYDALKDE